MSWVLTDIFAIRASGLTRLRPDLSVWGETRPKRSTTPTWPAGTTTTAWAKPTQTRPMATRSASGAPGAPCLRAVDHATKATIDAAMAMKNRKHVSFQTDDPVDFIRPRPLRPVQTLHPS